MQGPRSRRPDDQKSPLWRAREEAGLTREQVASIAQPPVVAKTIERWEKGQTAISHMRMKQLALIYHVTLTELVAA